MLTVVDEVCESRLLGDRIIPRFYERIGGVEAGVQEVGVEVIVVRDDVIKTERGQQADLRITVPGIDAERNVRPAQRIEDRAMEERDAVFAADGFLFEYTPVI